MVDVALRLRNLRVNFYTYDGVVQAIDGVDIELRKGETLGLVGETGCGKSVTVQSIVRLIPEPPGRIEVGEAFLDMPESDYQRMLELEAMLSDYFSPTQKQEDGMVLPEIRQLRKLRDSIRRGRAVRPQQGRGAGVPEEELADAGGGGLQAVETISSSTTTQKNVRQSISDLPLVEELLKIKSKYEIMSRSPAEIRKIRGNRIGMVFQEPGAALNPVLNAERQIGEVFLIHRHDEICDAVAAELDAVILQGGERAGFLRVPICKLYKRLLGTYKKQPKSKVIALVDRIPGLKRWRRWLRREVRRRVVELLRKVRIPNPEKVADQYPHELSGGMQQRVLIAMALAANPDILIADEPTTALDVTIQAQILKLMQSLREQLESSIIFITHDLAVIAQVCDRVSVMYAGTICEVGSTREIFKSPLHPYTQGLVKAVPRPDADMLRLEEIPGTVPNLIFPPSGCRFHPRCPLAKQHCKDVKPSLVKVDDGHSVACHIYGPEGHLWEESR